MFLAQDRSLDLLASSPARYYCITNAPLCNAKGRSCCVKFFSGGVLLINGTSYYCDFLSCNELLTNMESHVIFGLSQWFLEKLEMICRVCGKQRFVGKIEC